MAVIGQCREAGRAKHVRQPEASGRAVAVTRSSDRTTGSNVVEPAGYRTTLRPEDATIDIRTTSRHEVLSRRDGVTHDMSPISGTKLTVDHHQRARSHPINRGRSSDGRPVEGFELTPASTRHWIGGRQRHIVNQLIDAGVDGALPLSSIEGDTRSRLWLASAKTTDLLDAVNRWTLLRGLGIEDLERGALARSPPEAGSSTSAARRTAVRSAALSQRPSSSAGAAGSCSRCRSRGVRHHRTTATARTPGPTSDHPAGGLSGEWRRAVCGTRCDCRRPSSLPPGLSSRCCRDVAEYPLQDLLLDGHDSECGTACYRCLLRHSNQHYHGLLDWRLGMAYLAALVDVDYDAGLSDEREPKPWLDSVNRCSRVRQRSSRSALAGPSKSSRAYLLCVVRQVAVLAL